MGNRVIVFSDIGADAAIIKAVLQGIPDVKMHAEFDGDALMNDLMSSSDGRVRIIFMSAEVHGVDVEHLVRKISGYWPQINIIILSSDPEKDDVMELIRCGAMEFIERPINPELVTLAVDNYILHESVR